MSRKYFSIYFLSCCLLLAISTQAWPEDSLTDMMAEVRYQVTAIDHKFDKKESKLKAVAYYDLLTQTEKMKQAFPRRAEPYIWQGIVQSAYARTIGKGFAALGMVKKARASLEQGISIDPTASNAAGYNALAMLYYKVPPWPISFGNKKKAEMYFQKALSTESNLDTNYRYGEYLIAKGDISSGLMYLRKAIAFENRAKREEEQLKKQEIEELILEFQSKE